MSASDKANSGKAALIRTIVGLAVVVLGLWGLFHVNPADAYL